jgi:CrcB protein
MGGERLERYIMVMLGGGIGSMARFAIGSAIVNRIGGSFPLGTVIVNITGSFLVGFIMTLLTARSSHPNWRLLLVVGFLGGYTTFSAFEYETFGLMRAGSPWMGLLNVFGSVMLGYLAVWMGAALVPRP